MQMWTDDRPFLAYQRQDQLRREAVDDRLARLTPGGPHAALRERVARTLTSLALLIAPPVGNVPYNALVSTGTSNSSRRRDECLSRP